MTPRWVSPLRYPGGKVRMASWLAAAFHDTPTFMGGVEVWLEPFGGGAGAALMALEVEGVPEAWIVERNPALAAFWQALTGPEADDLAQRVHESTATLSGFLEARERVAAALAGEACDRLDLAYAAFVLNRCSRSGMVLPNVGPIGGLAQAGRYTVGSRFDGPRLAERLRHVSAFGDRLRVFDGDGISRIESLRDSGIEDEVFVFADPPYIGVGNGLYAKGMDTVEHQRLATALRACPSPWVLTYDAHPDVLDLYRGLRVFEFDIPHSAHKGHIGTEYVVASDNAITPPGHPLGRGAVMAPA